MDAKYVDFAVEKTLELLAVDSPSGYTHQVEEWLLAAFGAHHL